MKKVILHYSKKDRRYCQNSLAAIDKILDFDLTLVVDTYIDSLMGEARRSKDKLEEYTASLEDIVAKRTRELNEQARNDGLTGLLNQRAFYQELKREVSRSNRLKHSVTLIYFDLDKFKQLNDTKGHRAGDQVLIQVANAVKENLRENEIAARYGGDEFCVILTDASLKQGGVAAKRFASAIEKVVKDEDISCSMGLACSSPEQMVDSVSLVTLADDAMYKAKKETGFSVCVNGQDGRVS